MADDSTITSSHPAATPTPADAPALPPAPDHRPDRLRLGWGARLLLVLTLLLALAGAGGAGYLFYGQQQQRLVYAEDQMRLTAELGTRNTQLTELKSQLQDATQQLAQDRAALMKATESRTQLQGRLAALEKEIAQISGAHRIDWMLREVEHFIQVAERRTSLLGDARGALALLQEADDIVRAMDEPAATRLLRDALIHDMHNLKLAADTSIDTDGLFLRIGQLVKRMPSLNIPRYELFQESPAATSTEPLPEDGLGLLWRRFTDFVRSLVRFQKHEKAKPLLLSAEREYLAQGIVLLLEQAQLALLRGDSQAYRLSLLEARSRVDGYIPLQTAETRIFLSELDALAAVKLRPPVPGALESQRAVAAFRDYWGREKIERQQLIRQIAPPAAAPAPTATPAAEPRP